MNNNTRVYSSISSDNNLFDLNLIFARTLATLQMNESSFVDMARNWFIKKYPSMSEAEIACVNANFLMPVLHGELNYKQFMECMDIIGVGVSIKVTPPLGHGGTSLSVLKLRDMAKKALVDVGVDTVEKLVPALDGLAKLPTTMPFYLEIFRAYEAYVDAQSPRRHKFWNRHVSDLGLSMRAQNVLVNVGGIEFFGQLASTTEDKLRKVKWLGPVIIGEIKDAMVAKGLKFGTDIGKWTPPQ